MRDEIEFALLGPLEVRVRGRPLPLGGGKQRALLALLLLHPNRVLPRERLIDDLWGERPPQTAVKAVQVYVWQLRKLLPEGTLLTRPPGYVLEVDPDSVDLQRFEHLVAEARGADHARASELFRAALDLWRGPPLAEFRDEPFARAETGRLQQVRLAVLEARIDADLALGRHAELIGELEALIAENPHREQLRAQLMLALYRAGRQPDALTAYRRARASLDELGIEPSATLRQLEKQILTQDATLELGSEISPPVALARRVSLPGPLVPTPLCPFVGRSGELGGLRSLLDRAETGEGGLVLLAGDAGGGKTRLVRELASEACARDMLVLYGASDAAVRVPYRPLREWFEFAMRICDPAALRECLGDLGDRVARLVPELARLTHETVPPLGDPMTDRYILHSAVAELLRRMSVMKPMLLVAEDLHWADNETLQLLRRLARTVPEARTLVVVTYRHRGEEISSELSNTIADLSRLDGVTAITLGNLSSQEVRAFIRRSTDAEATAELASAVEGLTRGTPLLLCELWRDLLESGAVEVAHARARLTRPIAEVRGPERIQNVVRQRLSRLSPETIAVLELAAVSGARFEPRVIAEAGALDRAALVAAVGEAVQSGMIEEIPGPFPACRFTHELVRRSVYNHIERIRRAELHLRVGEALEHIYADDPSRVIPELAYHFTLAGPLGDIERAVDYNLRAADAAISAVGFDEAVTRLSSALELGIRDPRERARVQVELGYLLNETGRISESVAILTSSLDAASGLEERGIAARALVQRSGQRLNSDPGVDPAEMLPVAEDAIETFEQLGDLAGLALAERLRGFTLRRQGKVGESVAAMERALLHADASGDQVTRRQVIQSLAWVLCYGPTPVDDALRRCRELLEATRGDRVLEAVISRCMGSLLSMAGCFDEARALVEKSSLVLDAVNQLTSSWVFQGIAAEAKELAGDRAGARQELAAQWLSMRGARGDAPDTRAMRPAYELALLYCDDGCWDDAEQCLSYGREVPEPTYFLRESVLRLAVEARLAAHHGELAEAVMLAQRAVEQAERSDFLNLRARTWLALAEVQRRNGRGDEAAVAVASAIDAYEMKGNTAAVAAVRTAWHDAGA